MELVHARVNPELCRGDGECEKVCIYGAPKLKDKGDGVFIAEIDEMLCRGCGVCAAVCPSSAIRMSYFGDAHIQRMAGRTLEKNKLVGFICNWAYELAGDREEVEGMEMMRVLCSGRLHPAHIIRAFEQGAKGVIGIGCYEKACHYKAVDGRAEKNFERAKELVKTLGIDPRRVHFTRLSPDHPKRLKEVVDSFRKTIKGVK
jgi:heterodisulfide reductase subunit A